MRNLLALIGLAVVIFVGVGYARGWYSFSLTAGSDGKTDINVKVDTVKLKQDAADGAGKVGSAIDGLKSAAAQPPATGAAPPAGLQGPK